MPSPARRRRKGALDALRADIAAQQGAAAVLAWTADSRTTYGTGDARRRGGELRARVVAETRAHGRLHVWFDPQTLGAGEPASCGFLTESGQAVADAKACATHRERWGMEGAPRVMPEVTQDRRGRAVVAEMADRAGTAATPWRMRADTLIGTMLRDAKAEHVVVRGALVTVHVQDARGRRATLEFERRDGSFALREWRDVGSGDVTVSRADDLVRVGGKVWFPRRVVVEGSSRGETVRTEVAIHDVQVDPRLDAATFTLVVPAGTLIRAGGKTVPFGPDLADRFALVELATAALRPPSAPTAPPPEPPAESPPEPLPPPAKR